MIDWGFIDDTDETRNNYKEQSEKPEVTLAEWLEQWEAAVLDGQSNISKKEAIRRYEQRQNDS